MCIIHNASIQAEPFSVRFYQTTKQGLSGLLQLLGDQRRTIEVVERRLSLDQVVFASLVQAERLRQASLPHAFAGRFLP